MAIRELGVGSGEQGMRMDYEFAEGEDYSLDIYYTLYSISFFELLQ